MPKRTAGHFFFEPKGYDVQTMLQIEYERWATTGADYWHEKTVAADRPLACIDRYLPGVGANVKMIDVATPMTYWRRTRSWQGAFEGWQPRRASSRMFRSNSPGSTASRWPASESNRAAECRCAILSGRHVVEILCAHLKQPFVSDTAAHV